MRERGEARQEPILPLESERATTPCWRGCDSRHGDPSLSRVARVARVRDKLRFSAVRLAWRVRTELRGRGREGERVGGGGRGEKALSHSHVCRVKSARARRTLVSPTMGYARGRAPARDCDHRADGACRCYFLFFLSVLICRRCSVIAAVASSRALLVQSTTVAVYRRRCDDLAVHVRLRLRLSSTD